MLKFISFGSGSSGNCYYLYTDTDSILIDVGVGIRILKKHFHNYGLRFEDVHHVLITHDHADHVKSVGSLSSDYHLPVYTTRKVHQGIERNYCVRKKIEPNHAHVIEKNVTFTLGEFKITPFGRTPRQYRQCWLFRGVRRCELLPHHRCGAYYRRDARLYRPCQLSCTRGEP